MGKNLTEASKTQQRSERNLAFKDRAVPHEFSEFQRANLNIKQLEVRRTKWRYLQLHTIGKTEFSISPKAN